MVQSFQGPCRGLRGRPSILPIKAEGLGQSVTLEILRRIKSGLGTGRGLCLVWGVTVQGDYTPYVCQVPSSGLPAVGSLQLSSDILIERSMS